MPLTLNGDDGITYANLNSQVTILLQPKNWIINGQFEIWQRGTTQTNAGYGSDDRWVNYHSSSTKTHSRQAFTVGQTDVPNNPTYFSRTVVTTTNNPGSMVFKRQSIEDVTKLAGKTITISFWAKADANKNMSIGLVQEFGTGGSTKLEGIGVQKFALTTTWQRFIKTLLLPTISGKTIGGNNNLQLYFWFDAGSALNALTDSLGNQSGTFDIANVSLVEGSVAVECQNQPYADVLYACGYYFQKIYVKWREGVTVAKQYNNIPVLGITPKRKVPAVTISNILSNEGTTYIIDGLLSPNLEMGTLFLLWDYPSAGIADISFFCSLEAEL